MADDKFWTDDPLVLLSEYNILPQKHLTTNQKLNALTRSLLLATLIMYAIEYKYWFTFLIIGIIIILVIKLMSDAKRRKEGFSIPPTYIQGAEPMTTIPPAFAEEWQIPPPLYDEYTNAGAKAADVCNASCADRPYNDDHPIYGQYIIANDMKPYQSAVVQHMPLNEARLYMNDEFTRDSLQFRNDMTRNYINKMDRFYRGGCYGTISPE